MFDVLVISIPDFVFPSYFVPGNYVSLPLILLVLSTLVANLVSAGLSPILFSLYFPLPRQIEHIDRGVCLPLVSSQNTSSDVHPYSVDRQSKIRIYRDLLPDTDDHTSIGVGNLFITRLYGPSYGI